MYDRQLEELLNSGKSESKSFFSQTDYKSAREAVQNRIALRSSVKPKPLWPFQLKAVFIAACFLAVICIFATILLSTPAQINNQGGTLAEQQVSLDGDKNGLISYFTVKAPDNPGTSIMSVLWDTDSYNSQMLYSTVFDKCDETYPASSLTFPDTGRKLVLIFSGSNENDFIDYRIIGYNDNRVKEWLSQDYVPGGKLGVKDGMIMEQSTLPFGSGQGGTSVTYIIPYDIRMSGELILPVQNVRLHIGEQILFVGITDQMLDVSSANGLVEKVASENGADDQHTLEYRAKTKGSDVLLINGSNLTASGLKINIID